MSTRNRFLATTSLLTILLLAFHPITPLGAAIWPTSDNEESPPEWSLPLFLLLFIAEASVSAFGVAYLFLGWSFTKAMLPSNPGLAKGMHVSLAFLLMQWWPHSNLHITVPFSFGAVLAIDYAFHFPIMIASLVVLAGIVQVARHRTGAVAGRGG